MTALVLMEAYLIGKHSSILYYTLLFTSKTFIYIYISMREGVVQEDNFRRLQTKLQQIGTTIQQANPGALVLSNQLAKQSQFKYSQAYEERLDQGDRPILMPFRFQGPFDQSIFPRIQEMLVQACQTVVSISFKILKEEKFSDSQAKLYAAKNILLNVQSLISQFAALIKNKLNRHDQVFLQFLTHQIDTILKEILTCLADGYPQAPITGGSQKMREIVKAVNRSDDETKDLIYNHNIRVLDYVQTSTNNSRFEYIERFNMDVYIDYIMEVINTAINVARQSKDDINDATLYQRFCTFNQKLIYLSSKNQFNEFNDNVKLAYLNKCFAGSQHLTTEVGLLSKELQSLQKLESKEQIEIQKMKKQKKFSSNTKIPNFVKSFTQYQLKERTYNASHSSILRIMTKWVQYLQSIFKNPEKMIRQRIYPFKDIHNKLIDAKNDDLKKLLIRNIRSEYRNVKAKLKTLKQSNTKFQSYFLSMKKEGSFATYLKRFDDTRYTASQVNFTLVSSMQEYLATLIHYLLKAGAVGQYGHVNLVSFRISDLIRSKLQFQQSTFINILKSIYLLDEQLPESVFRLIRVKDKLDDKDNNIIVNYLFMGKVECELQLSIQEVNKKEKHNYTFSHFLYELTRGMFGPISECSSIISQCEPILTSCKEKYYPQKRNPQIPLQEQHQFTNLSIKSERYICCSCKCQIFRENTQIFNEVNRQCNKCIVRKDNANTRLNAGRLRGFLNEHKDLISKFITYSELKEIKKGFLLSLPNFSNINKFVVSSVIKNQKEQKWYLVKISDQFFIENEDTEIYGEHITYTDITSKVKEKVNNKYVFQQLTYYITEERFRQLDFHRNRQFFQIEFHRKKVGLGLAKIRQSFQEYRAQKELVDLIKSKNEIIDASNDLRKVEILNCLLQGKTERLQYNIYNQINFNFIKRLYLASTLLQEIDISKMTRLACFNAKGNQIVRIDLSANLQLTELNLDSNHLTEIDLSKNRKLVKINLTNNHLTEFKYYDSDCLVQAIVKNNHLRRVDLRNLDNVLRIEVCGQGTKQMESISVVDAKKLTYFSLDMLPGTLNDSSIVFKNVNENCQIFINRWIMDKVRTFMDYLKRKYRLQIICLNHNQNQ